METWSRHSVLTDLTHRSAMALARESGQYQYCAPDGRKGCHNSCRGHERGNGPVLGPKRSFRQLLRRPRSGRMRRYVNVENLAAGVMDHEEHVERSKRYGLDAKEVACPHLRSMLPQEGPPCGGRPATMGSLHIL